MVKVVVSPIPSSPLSPLPTSPSTCGRRKGGEDKDTLIGESQNAFLYLILDCVLHNLRCSIINSKGP